MKSCETSIFFTPWPENKIRKIPPWKPKKLFKKSIFSWWLSNFSKYIGQGVPLAPLLKNFIAGLDELDHAKKSCENVNIFGRPPPPKLWKFRIFFLFWMNPSLMVMDRWTDGLTHRRTELVVKLLSWLKINFELEWYDIKGDLMYVSVYTIFERIPNRWEVVVCYVLQ